MILQALARYYEDLLSRGEIAAPGWSPTGISYALCLDGTGALVQVIPTMQEELAGKKTVLRPQRMVLPAPVKKASGVSSNFLWENAGYLLGVKQGEDAARSRKCFQTAAALHHAILDGVDSPVAQAILAYFDSWQPEQAESHELARHLHQAMARLPDKERAVLEGMYLCREDAAGMADALHVSTSHIYRLQKTGIRRIRGMLSRFMHYW